MNYDNRLNKLKLDIDHAKSIKYRSEAKLEQLENQKKEILSELDRLNLKPEELDSEIEKINKEIERLFNEAESLLPKDLLGKMKNE
ncbi:MAG: hypothetical protein GXZ08_07725 [Tissierellia bacterium]|nr:hypothetical protein [Tissierellia bacterium]